MHYANGRPANNGDHVVAKNYNNQIVTGVIYNLRAGETCNCDISVLIPGGSQQLTCQTVGTMYHAEDAFDAIAPKPATVAERLSKPKTTN